MFWYLKTLHFSFRIMFSEGSVAHVKYRLFVLKFEVFRFAYCESQRLDIRAGLGLEGGPRPALNQYREGPVS